MRRAFIINENVIIFAATIQDADGNRDDSSNNLFQAIIGNCHQFTLDPPTWERWQKQLGRLRRDLFPTVPSFLRTLASLHYNAKKLNFLSEATPLANEDSWSTKLLDDKEFIRLAAACHGVLVTGDNPLIRDVTSISLPNQYEFEITGVPRALLLASVPST